jgi:hypothetical protein
MKRRIVILLGAVAMLSILSLACVAQQRAEPGWSAHPEMHAKWQAWRDTMKQTPLPEKGCFRASYPGMAWQKTSCAARPSVHYSTPPAGAAFPNMVGDGTNYFGEVPSTGPFLSSVTGSFPTVTGLASVNAYSLQVNTNIFQVPSWCDGAADPSACYGWEQFIYDEATSELLIEYTLINWGSTNCPSPINEGYYTIPGTSNWIACWVNTPVTSVAAQALANLPYMEMTGEVSGNMNEAILWTGDSNIYATTDDDLFGSALADNWDVAEFGVFGANSGDPEATFNSGTTFLVEESLNNGATAAPQCSSTSGFFTTEYNNLNLVGPCCPYSGSTPNIQFMESNASGATATCGASGVEGNFAAAPYSIDGSETMITHPIILGEIRIQYTATLEDSTPGATIHTQLFDECGDSLGTGSQSPGTVFEYINTEVEGESCTYGFRAMMYATAPGYLQSETSTINF